LALTRALQVPIMPYMRPRVIVKVAGRRLDETRKLNYRRSAETMKVRSSNPTCFKVPRGGSPRHGTILT
jgi:hypothetical protein